jgi:phosphoribosylformylglycinamidine cyclo-ligase
VDSYEARGVSSTKGDVKRALSTVPKGLYPGAFALASPDVLTASPDYCILVHADGAGTKSALAYIYHRLYHNPDVFRGIAQDCLVMNLDDLICVGATGPFVLSNIINRNALLVKEDVVRAVVEGYDSFCRLLAAHDIEVVMGGGETADAGDLVRTIAVDAVLVTRMRRAEFIDASRISPGLAIVGLSSTGRASYETSLNSGIGSNGFTSARHEVLSSRYRNQFPETFAPEIGGLAYTGDFELGDPLPGSAGSVGEALLSPTRTYAPILKTIFDKGRYGIRGIVHNTGGGQTKCLGFGENIRYVKDNLFDPPPIFTFLSEKIGIPPSDMVRTFNVGHRMELYCSWDRVEDIVQTSQTFDVAAQVVGRTEKSAGGNELLLQYQGRTLRYGDTQHLR